LFYWNEKGLKKNKPKAVYTKIFTPASGHSTFLIEAIEQREKELRNLDEWLNTSPTLQQVQPADIAAFVKTRLAALCDLLNSDVTQARAELLRHVSEIRLAPQQRGSGSEYVASGEWNLLGKDPETDRARRLLGVRARLVAGACNHPNCLVLPFSLELIRLTA
jgi:hypothetical protein